MTASSENSFRQQAGAAQELIEQMQPDIARRWWCLGLLADAIQAAHRANPERWGVTLFHDLVRLNVGMIEVAFFGSSDEIYMVLDAATLAEMPEAQPYLRQDSLANLAGYRRGEWAGKYTSVAGSLGNYLALGQLPHAYPLLRPAHQSLILSAAQTRRHGETRGNHSPGVIDYLRAATGWPLPQPAYLS